MKEWINKLDRKMVVILDFCWVGCLVYLMGIVVTGVIGRFTGTFSIGWFEETVYLALSWMVFGKAALLFRNNEHLRVEFIDKVLFERPKAMKIYKIVVDVVILICTFAFSWASLKLCLTTPKVSPMLRIPYKFWYFALFFSMVLASLYIIVELIKELLS